MAGKSHIKIEMERCKKNQLPLTPLGFFFCKNGSEFGSELQNFLYRVWDGIMTKQKLEKRNAASVPVL